MTEQALAEKQNTAPVRGNDSAAIIQVIERAASDPSVDIEKMERLLDMQERILNRNAEMAFNESLRAAQAEMPQVYRNAKNDQTRSSYATYEQLSAAVMPVATKHGFSLSFGTDNSPLEGHYRITCTMAHKDGYSRSYHADVPSDTVGMKGNQNKTATHGFGSTMSYGRRYLTLLIFNVATSDDNDGNQQRQGAERVSQEQADQITARLAETESDRDRFLKALAPKINCRGLASIGDIPASCFGTAMQMIENNAKRKQQGSSNG